MWLVGRGRGVTGVQVLVEECTGVKEELVKARDVFVYVGVVPLRWCLSTKISDTFPLSKFGTTWSSLVHPRTSRNNRVSKNKEEQHTDGTTHPSRRPGRPDGIGHGFWSSLRSSRSRPWGSPSHCRQCYLPIPRIVATAARPSPGTNTTQIHHLFTTVAGARPTSLEEGHCCRPPLWTTRRTFVAPSFAGSRCFDRKRTGMAKFTLVGKNMGHFGVSVRSCAPSFVGQLHGYVVWVQWHELPDLAWGRRHSWAFAFRPSFAGGYSECRIIGWKRKDSFVHVSIRKTVPTFSNSCLGRGRPMDFLPSGQTRGGRREFQVVHVWCTAERWQHFVNQWMRARIGQYPTSRTSRRRQTCVPI